MPSTVYQASCHCGRIKFEAEGELTSVMSCNCSMCQRKGTLMWFVPRSALRLFTPEEDTSVYLFNKHVIQHRFCPTCGIHPYGEGKAPNGDEMAAVNVRCIEGIDLAALPVTHHDGRAM
ncbi:GFA family protein [Ideonella azotifigens]|uniref:GFA family protein n=1 Tax=Ideonella azotifigens TaxID=513160 RepID=A0ABN1KLA1_9BURK|nr:GFA family protein [Ideonella azotifigens]MCD2339203.1 GFA family protein [Ideonella azotifigens]